MEYLEIDNKENAINSLLGAEEHPGPVQGDGTCRSAFHWKYT